MAQSVLQPNTEWTARFAHISWVQRWNSLLQSPLFVVLVSLLTVIFVGWRLKKTDIYDEFTNGGTLSRSTKIFGMLWFLIRYIAPVAIIAIFISGLFA